MKDEETLLQLSAFADGELPAAAAGQVETELASRPELRRQLARFRRLDRAVAVLPVPALDESAGRALWAHISDRTARAARAGSSHVESEGRDLGAAAAALPAPEVPEPRWHEIWTGIQERTRAARVVARPPATRYWRYWSAMAAAAVLLVAVALSWGFWPHTVGPGNHVEALDAPEALDQNYVMMYKAVPGLEKPVLCFYQKAPEPEPPDDDWDIE